MWQDGDIPPSTELSSWRLVRKWNFYMTVSTVVLSSKTCRSHPGETEADLSYLSIDGKVGRPAGRWDDLAYSILAPFRSDLPDVFHWVAKVVFCWSEGRCILKAMRTDPLVRFPYSEWMTSALNGGHVERRGSASAEWDVRRICRVGGIISSMFVEGHLESGIDRRRGCQGSCGRSPTRRRWDHHSAGDTDKKAEMSNVAMGSIELDMEELAETGQVRKEGR